MIRQATDTDLPQILALVQAAGLPIAGLAQHGEHAYVLEIDGAIIGTVAFESYPPYALLRSLAVTPGRQGNGHGHQLMTFIIDEAWRHGLRQLFTLTTTIPAWLLAEGFTEIARSDVPAALLASEEFRGACPISARIFRKSRTS